MAATQHRGAPPAPRAALALPRRGGAPASPRHRPPRPARTPRYIAGGAGSSACGRPRLGLLAGKEGGLFIYFFFLAAPLLVSRGPASTFTGNGREAAAVPGCPRSQEAAAVVEREVCLPPSDTMKAVSPVRHPSRKAQPGVAGGGGGHPALRCLAEHSGCKGGLPSGEEPAALCLQCDMNDCYSRLRKLVPTIPPNKRVSKVEILQHVIDYILDLQLALETHPALLRQQQQPPALHPGSCPAGTPRTPLTALNTDPVRGAFHASPQFGVRSGEHGTGMTQRSPPAAVGARPGDASPLPAPWLCREAAASGGHGADGHRKAPAVGGGCLHPLGARRDRHGVHRIITVSRGSSCNQRVCTHWSRRGAPALPGPSRSVASMSGFGSCTRLMPSAERVLRGRTRSVSPARDRPWQLGGACRRGERSGVPQQPPGRAGPGAGCPPAGSIAAAPSALPPRAVVPLRTGCSRGLRERFPAGLWQCPLRGGEIRGMG